MMSDGIGKHLNIFLIKNILSEIWIDNQKNFNDLTASSKYNDLVNFNNKINVDDENSVDTNIKVINENITPTNSRSNFSNLISNNRLNSFTQESVYNGNYNALHQMEDEWDDFENEHKERQLEEMLIIENKSFLKNKISEKEKKATSNPTSNLVKNSSFITRCTKQRPMVCYDYLCKTRSPSFKRVELLTPAKDKKWLEDYKMELQFLQENFSEVLPEILYDVVRKRVTDPVHYIVHYLIKYKVDNFKNDNIIYKPLY